MCDRDPYRQVESVYTMQCDIAKYPERRVIRLIVYSIPVDIY